MDYDCISKLIKYSPESGKLFWVKRDDVCKSWNTRYAGKEAFTATLNGYKYGKILGKNYYAHRIAWLIMNGEFADEIDHIDGNRSNNIYNNLRSVSHQNNMKNITMQSNNNSGVVGVYWNRSRCKWHAQIGVNGKSHHIGYFSNIDDAVNSRKKYEDIFGYHKNHGKGV